MSEFTEVVQRKIEALEDELSECEDTASRLKAKITTLQELLDGETGASPSKKRGRPKGAKNKKQKDSTTSAPRDNRVDPAELAEAAYDYSLKESYGPGVHPGEGWKRRGDQTVQSDATISIEDEEHVPV